MSSTAKEKGYNGYTNYETWNYCLWMDNEPGEAEYCRELAREAKEHPVENQYMTLDRRIVHALKDSLKAHYEEQAEAWMPDQSSHFADMLNSAMGSINWYEVAENLLEDLDNE